MTAPHAFSRPSIIFSFSDKPASDVVDEESNEEFQAKKKAAGGISNNLSDEQALEMIAKVCEQAYVLEQVRNIIDR